MPVIDRVLAPRQALRSIERASSRSRGLLIAAPSRKTVVSAPEDDRVRMALRDPVGLERRVVSDHDAGVRRRVLVLSHIRDNDFERDAELGEQLPAAGRGRCKDEAAGRGHRGQPYRPPNMLKANPLASIVTPYTFPHAPRACTDQHHRRGPRRKPPAHPRRLRVPRGARGPAGRVPRARDVRLSAARPAVQAPLRSRRRGLAPGRWPPPSARFPRSWAPSRPTAGGSGRPFYNAAAFCHRGKVALAARKCLLPTYDVFDEDRYFEPAAQPTVIVHAGVRIGVTICEDIWTHPMISTRRLYSGLDPVKQLAAQKCDLMVNLSASPWNYGKGGVRQTLVTDAARALGCPVAYVNAVGGNDELIFDGRSLVSDPGGPRPDRHGRVRRGADRGGNRPGPAAGPMAALSADVRAARDGGHPRPP